MSGDGDLIVIPCPGKEHRHRVYRGPGKSDEPKPKMLFCCTPDTQGEILVQCGDGLCRRSAKPTYNGWYRVRLSAGSYTIEPIPKKKFDLIRIPGVVLAGEK